VFRWFRAQPPPKLSTESKLLIALVIGTILNLINQGDALMAGATVNLFKLFLTYLVPYCVATYGAVSLRMKDGLRLGA